MEVNCVQFDPKSNSIPLLGGLEFTMRKSIQVAYSYAKIFVKKVEPLNSFFSKNPDINLLNIYKDSVDVFKGSSAGCSFAALFVSLALQKPIRQNLAMTGQISYEGKIGGVGGIKEKVTAAFNEGLQLVIIPKENKLDYEILPIVVKKNLTVKYAETFEDIYKIAFE